MSKKTGYDTMHGHFNVTSEYTYFITKKCNTNELKNSCHHNHEVTLIWYFRRYCFSNCILFVLSWIFLFLDYGGIYIIDWSSLIQVMAWHWTSTKPLPESMLNYCQGRPLRTYLSEIWNIPRECLMYIFMNTSSYHDGGVTLPLPRGFVVTVDGIPQGNWISPSLDL